MMILSKLNYNELNFKNNYKPEDALRRSVIVILSHPFTYCRVLIQIGYEPLKPILIDTFFGGSRYAYPSIFKYMSFIKQEDGMVGLFRGMGHRLCSELTNEFFYVNSLDICKQIDNLQHKKQKKDSKSDEDDDSFTQESVNEEKECAHFNKESILKLYRRLFNESISRIIALTFSYPLHVCFIRSCSQFIGREKIYNFNPFNIINITKEGNFYDGFIPKLFAELLILWVTNSLFFSVDVLIKQESKIFMGYFSVFINFFVSATIYPLQLTSTVMAVNHSSSLLASKIEPPFYNWKTCYESLKRRNQLKRGSSLMWRYVANAYKPQLIIRPYLDSE